MASNISNIMKQLSYKKNTYLFMLISFFAVILILGIKSAYAYYQDTLSSGILANKIGDFASTALGDINMIIYKETEEGVYTRVYSIPSAYYVFDDTQTNCTIPCNDGSGNCEYTYNSVNNNISLTSNQKVTCSFYFKAEAFSDINVYIMAEDENGEEYTYTTSSGESVTKNYSVVDGVPSYGYKYTDGYSCVNGSTVTYNSETRKFTVAAASKDDCYVFFDSEGSSDIVVNTYVQTASGSDTYKSVTTIPGNNVYVLNTEKSICTDVNGVISSDIITYEEGYINIITTTKQTCDVYLDLSTN